MEIIDGKLCRKILTRKMENDPYELTLYKEIKNVSNSDIPEYKETGKSLGVISINGQIRKDPFHLIYNDETYTYMDDIEELFEVSSLDHIRLCLKTPDVNRVILDHKALTYIGLLCGARHDMVKASELNLDNETTFVELFLVIDDKGHISDILYTHDIEIWDLKRRSDIPSSELVSVYNTDIKSYPRDIVTKIIESYMEDQYSGNDLSKILSIRTSNDIEFEIHNKGKDDAYIIIDKSCIDKLSGDIRKFDITIEFEECCDAEVTIELPHKLFPTKDGLYSKANDDHYSIPITQLIGAIMYHDIFTSMSYNLEKGDVFNWSSYEDIVGIDCPAINLYDGIYIDELLSEKPILKRFYALDRSAFENVWKIYNCDKFEKLWLAYIDKYNIDRL